MKTKDKSLEKSRRNSPRRILPWVVAGVLILGVLSVMPSVWALPQQVPDFQTVPTLTPIPPPATDPPPATSAPTDTPGPAGAPTATPGAGAPTATPSPGALTATPGAATSTATPGAGTPTASATPTRLGVTAVPIGPGACWTMPTPGFKPVRSQALEFEVNSDQALVVPGQTLTLRLTATNLGNEVIGDVLICNPLDPALQRGKSVVSQGRATLAAEGLIIEFGDLLPGDSATAQISLTIPADFPLGGVIQDQAWLFAQNQRASTGLLTWALPPVVSASHRGIAASCASVSGSDLLLSSSWHWPST